MSDDKNSDSSEDEIVHSRKSSKCKAVLDSDEENDHEEEKQIENHNESSTDHNMNDSVISKPILSNYKALIDSDSSSEDEEEIQKPQMKQKIKAASSSDDSDISGDSGDDDMVIPKNHSEPKEQRKSAAKCVEMSYKKAEELKQTIQSEKQRMERDAEISVPYHRPKQHTLKEFLARKTAITSSTSLERFKNMKNPMRAIKVAIDEQEILVQQSKVRQEESEEFFSKCVSDDDEENDNFEIPQKPEDSTDIEKELQPICETPILSTEEVAPTDPITEVESNEIPTNSEPEDIFKINDNELDLMESSDPIIPTDSEEIPILSNALPQTPIDTDVQETVAETQSPVIELNTNQETNENEKELMETDETSEDPELERLRKKYITNTDEVPSQVESENIVVDYNMFDEDVNVKNEIVSTSQTKNLPFFPSLQGKDNEDMVIDLISGDVKPRKLTGPEILRESFIRNTKKPKHKESISLNLLSVENGKLESKNVEFKLNEETEFDHNKPGLSHERLKQNLLNQILKKRREQMEIKMKAEAEEAKGSKEGFEDDAEIDSEEDDEEECDEEIDETENASDNENDGTDGFVLKESAEDDEAIVEDEAESEDDEESDSSSSEEETENADKKTQRKGRIIKAFVDSDDEDSKSVVKNDTPAEVATESLQEGKPSYSENLPSELKSLCDPTVSQDQDNDLLEICSGQFAATQATNALFSQSDNLPLSTQDDNELMLLCSGQFVTQANDLIDKPSLETQQTESQNVILSPIKSSRFLLSSSEDEDEPQKEANKRKKKKSKKKKRKLGFSDDEETEDTKENKNPSSEMSEEEAVEDEEEEIFLDYDSEENEVEVKLNKKERIKAANAYLENEADLSGSEWGSADEDEKEMDKLMAEMGDEEHFDQDQLKEEVGRIHMRKMLDDDLKNVKKITNLLFDDEENDGADRERKFRWKNNTDGFNVDDENARDADEAMKEVEELDEDSEILWRKIRHERETILAEQSQKDDNSENINENVLMLDHQSQTVSTSNTSLTKRKFQIIKMNKNVENDSKKESPFLISKTYGSSASFLARDVTTLNKLANFTKNATDDVSNVGSGSGRGNQFVFTTLSPSVVESKKRKSEETNSSLNPNNKKPKLIEKSSRKKLMLLDQLN
ncbi:unnamed protein product [Diamesa serratosioi]